MPVEGWDVPTFSQPVVHQRYPLSKAISGDRWSIYFQEQMPFLISNHQLSKHQSWRHRISASSSSRMRIMNHNWSATKQRFHSQSVAEISRHSVLSGDRIRQCLATRTQISVCKSPFPSAGTAVSLFRAKTVQQRPLLPMEVETRLPDCGVTH